MGIGFRWRSMIARSAIGVTVVALMLLGCNNAPPPRTITGGEANLARINQAYLMASQGLKHPPRNEKELMPYIEELGESSDVLRSPGDGEKFVIIWNLKPEDLTPKPPGQGMTLERRLPIVAYEQRGKDGERVVLQAGGRVTIMTDGEFSEAYFPAGHKPK
jgi:hypothetical protein